MNYTKDLINLIDYVEELVEHNQKRRKILDMALNCKSESEKINFLENCGHNKLPRNENIIDELMIDNCISNNYDFLEENDLYKHDHLFEDYLQMATTWGTFTNDDWLTWAKNINIYQGETELKKIISKRKSELKELAEFFYNVYPNGDQLIKRYKLNEFSFWYGSAYQDKIEETEEEISKEKEVIKQWQKELNGGLSQEEKELIAKQRGIVFLKDTTSGGEVKTYFAN